MLALYQETDNPVQVNAAVFALVAAGLRVFAATEPPAGFRAEKTLRLNGADFTEVP